MHCGSDPKLLTWIREHPVDQAKVGLSLEHGRPPSGASSSSTAPAPAASTQQHPATLPPGELTIFDDDDGHVFSQVASCLVSRNVDEVDAQRCACSTVKGADASLPKGPTGIVGLHGQGGLARAARRRRSLNLKGLEVLDMRTNRPDGEPWNFDNKTDRGWALRLQGEQRPTWAIAPPPCTAFTVQINTTKYPKMHVDEVRKRIQQGMVHLKCVAKIYRYQVRHDRCVRHTQPRAARSWRTAPIQRALKHPSALGTSCHQCRYGAGTRGRDGEVGLILEPARFMSNSAPMLKRISNSCRHDHKHQLLEGRGRTQAAAIYPLPLLKANLQGMADTTCAESSVRQMADDAYVASLTLSMREI